MRGTAHLKRNLTFTFAAMVWLAAVVCGFAVLHRHEFTPAPLGSPAAVWPSGTPLTLEKDRLTFVLAVHPRCPCTEATVVELNELLTPGSQRGRLNALVFKPVSADDWWIATSTVHELMARKDAQIWTDVEGALAARFGAVTSGTLLVFNPQGVLEFAGGVTPVRGQTGPNAGASTVAALLDGHIASVHSSPVFGCSLVSTPNGRGGER
jgi:hypothetical protein